MNAAVILLAIVAAVLLIVLIVKMPQMRAAQEVLEAEKAELETELNDLSQSYDMLKTENDTLNEKILEEQEKISALMDRMQELRNNSYAEINKYKKEIGTLREVLRSYIVQVDSLNLINSQLRAENKEVKQQMDWVRERNDKLEKESEELKEVVEKAAILHAQNTTVTPINARGKRVDWKKCGQLRTDFTIDKNITAKRGNRTIYLRILRPDGGVLNSDGSTFIYQNTKLEYSAKREIEYEGEALETAIFCENDGTLTKGEYKAEIFSNNELMATYEFFFK